LPADTNPADWILDIASADFYSSSVTKSDADQELRRLLDAHYERETKPKVSMAFFFLGSFNCDGVSAIGNRGDGIAFP